MVDSNLDAFETRLRHVAAGMDYPPTPDITAGVRRRLDEKKRPAVVRPWYANRLVWAAAAVLLAAAILMAVPQARAAIFEFFQIGDIRIFPSEPTVTPSFEDVPETGEVTGSSAGPEREPAFSAANLYGESTPAEVQSELGEALIRPDYPTGVGAPDKVFLQELGGPVGILVWLETDSIEKAWAVLYILALDEGAFGGKFQMDSLTATEVNGRKAYWVEGQHLLFFYDESGNVVSQSGRLVEGNTLVWTVEGITYRLETVLSLEEAVRMAESMR